MVEEPDPPEDADEDSGESVTSDDVSPEESAPNVLQEGTSQADPAGPETPADDEPLPEWEELTPEFFEDECLRGDFMLRWAAILLAVLFGWNYLVDSAVLVQIKTGEFIAGNGFLPPRVDPFAVATEGKSWVNLHWLADLVIGMTQSVGGFQTLTVLTALKIGLSFWILSRISFRGVSTWWASICAVVAIVALYPAMQPGAMSVTIFGWSLLLGLLFTWSQRPNASVLWGLPVLFLFWSNADSRAWTGLLFFLVFLICEAATKAANKRQLMIGGIALLAAILISPWPLQPALGVYESLAQATEAQSEGLSGELFPRYAYGMMAPEFWEMPDVFAIAATVMLGLSFIALFLNASRLPVGLTAGWIVVNGLTFYFGELVPYAAIVNCVVATLQGQDWYRHRFQVSYDVHWQPVLFARLGRAVTVGCFFFVAYATINGYLVGPQGKRIGMGLDPRLENRLTSTAESLLPGIYGDRVFNVRADQGDMLIWLDRKPYLDSRNGLFVNSETNFAVRHRKIRDSIFRQGPLAENEDNSEQEVSWQEEFTKLEMQSLILRLWGPTPAYSPFMMLVGTRFWPMTGFGAAGAVFTRGDVEDADLTKHIEDHIQTDFVKQAFDVESAPALVDEPVQIWPRTTSSYDQWLVQELDATPNEIQLARHYVGIANRLQQTLTMEQGIALSVLAVRSVAAGLLLAPDNADAYRVLVDAQSLIEGAEQRFLQVNGANYPLGIRGQQVVCYAFHAAKASDGAKEDLKRLFIILVGSQSFDLAGRIAEQYAAKYGERITDTPGQDDEAREQGTKMLEEIEDLVLNVETEIETARSEEASTSQLANIALRGNCPGIALSILEEDMTVVASDPGIQLTYASLLMANGRTEDGWEQLEGMQGLVDQAGAQNPNFVTQWREATAIANLVANVRERAADLYDEEAVTFNRNSLRSLFFQPPAAAAPASSIDIWPAITLRTHYNALISFPERWATLKLQQALILIDQGDLENAQQALTAIYDEHPEFSMRPLVVFYLTFMSEKEYEMLPPSQWIPVWDGMFVPDEGASDTDAPQEMKPNRDPASESTATPATAPDRTQKIPPAPALPERSE